MCRHTLILGLLAILSFTAAAENIVMVHGTYLNVGRSYTSKSGDVTVDTTGSSTTWGAAATGWFEVGSDVGVLAGVRLTFPTRAQATVRVDGKKVGEDLDEELKDGGLALAGELGVGWKLGAPDVPLSMILGGGAHVGSVTVYPPKGSEADNASNAVLGVYLQTFPIFQVTDWSYLAAGVMLSYGFLDLGHEPKLPDGLSYSGGWTLGLSFGGGFSF